MYRFIDDVYLYKIFTWASSSNSSFSQDDISARDKALGRNRARLLKKAEEKRRNDDPYYCGFSARVPAFNHKKVPRERAASRDVVK